MAKTVLAVRVAVITGAARGIGLAVAELAASRGAAIAIWDMDEAASRAAAARLGQAHKVSTHILDLTDATAVEAATQATLAAHGQMDILVNNAGITGGNAISIRLHQQFGFKHIGTMKDVGLKQGKLLDVDMFQLIYQRS